MIEGSSTAPLNRDEQIKLMQNASSRLDSFVKKWKSSETVSDILSEVHDEIANGQLGRPAIAIHLLKSDHVKKEPTE